MVAPLLSLIACISPEYGTAPFLCASGRCPEGYVCVDGRCQFPGKILDDGAIDTLDVQDASKDRMQDGSVNPDLSDLAVQDTMEDRVVKDEAIPPDQSPITNLIPNHNMEGGAWQSGNYASTSPTLVWATDHSHSPTHSLKTTGSGTFWGFWRAPAIVGIQPGSTYAVSMWVKTTGLVGQDGATVNIFWHDGTGKEAGWSPTIGGAASGTTAWQQIAGVVVAPSAAASALLELRVHADAGTAWIDDVSLSEL